MGLNHSGKAQQTPQKSHDNQRAISELKIVFKEDNLNTDNKDPQVSERQVNKVVHRCVGALLFQKFNKQMAVGTGFLISNDLVLTCAHNIYDRENQFYYNKIKFYTNSENQNWESYGVTHGFIPQQFKFSKENERYQYDYGLLTLDRQVQGQQFLHLSLQFQQVNLKEQISIYGYPGKNVRLLQNGNQQTSFQPSLFGLSLRNAFIKTPNDEKNQLISYDIKAYEGQSGSPVLASIGQHANIVVAIHIGTESINEQNRILSKGRLITSDLLDNLNKWRKKSYGSAFIQWSIDKIKQQVKYIVKSEIIDNINKDLKWEKIDSFPLIDKYQNVLQYLKGGKNQFIMKCTTPLQIPFKKNFRFNHYSKNSSLQIGLLASNLKEDICLLVYTSDSLTKTSNIFHNNQFAIEDNELLFMKQGEKLALEIKSKSNTISFMNMANNTKFQFTLSQQFIINPLFLSLGMSQAGQIQIIEPLSSTT